jgi:drug/metabolite transporter (DMT)-like permease
MSPLVIILWVSNICFDTLGQVAFKFAAIAPNNRDGWYYWLDLVWLAFLTLVPLSQGVLLASFNIITIMLVGRVIFKELLTIYRLIGMLLITAGVIFVGMS